MTAVRRHAHITRPVPPPRDRDVDDEPLTEAERAALAANDGTYVSWDGLKAELHL